MTKEAYEQMMTGLKEAEDEFRRTVFPDCTAKYHAVMDAIKLLTEQKTIVRCKDCKHAVLTSKGEAKYCQFWQEDEDGNFGGDPLYLDGDFFCAGGERRDDDD